MISAPFWDHQNPLYPYILTTPIFPFLPPPHRKRLTIEGQGRIYSKEIKTFRANNGLPQFWPDMFSPFYPPTLNVSLWKVAPTLFIHQRWVWSGNGWWQRRTRTPRLQRSRPCLFLERDTCTSVWNSISEINSRCGGWRLIIRQWLHQANREGAKSINLEEVVAVSTIVLSQLRNGGKYYYPLLAFGSHADIIPRRIKEFVPLIATSVFLPPLVGIT